jgi:hypothetical protein
MFRATRSIDGSLTGRLERARQSGYADGVREAKLMLLALGKPFELNQAMGWLNTVVEEGAQIFGCSARSIARLKRGKCLVG